jgi:ribosome-associated protein
VATTKKKPAAKKKAAGKKSVKPKAKDSAAHKKKPATKGGAKKTLRRGVIAPKPPRKKAAVEHHGLPEIAREAALKVLDERKADDVMVIDARGRSAMTDYIVVATGGSARQLAAIADYLRQAFAKNGIRTIRVEGLPQGDWVLVDAGDVVVHLFRPDVRRYYAIEDIWAKTHGG